MFAENAVKEYIQKAESLLAGMDTDSVVKITHKLNQCFLAGGRVFICGNGGSASDASHFAGELIGRFRRERNPLPAIALSSDTSVLTALANDYGYEEVFSRQIKALGAKGDVLVAITTSGASSNVLKAAEAAGESGMSVIAFTSKLIDKTGWADIHWKSGSTETSHTQEQMLIAFHAICYGLEMIIAEKG